jgi:hypothetical protein
MFLLVRGTLWWQLGQDSLTIQPHLGWMIPSRHSLACGSPTDLGLRHKVTACSSRFRFSAMHPLVATAQEYHGLSTNDIGEYFVALSNEANLAGIEGSWLVVGVKNRSRAVVGSNFCGLHGQPQGITQQIAHDIEPPIGFRGVSEVSHADGRDVMFQVHAAPQGIPIAWKGPNYGRNGESLDALDLNKLGTIRAKSGFADWSGQTVESARIEHQSGFNGTCVRLPGHRFRGSTPPMASQRKLSLLGTQGWPTY